VPDPAKNNNILGPDDSELRALVPGSLVPVIGHWILDLSELHAIVMGCWYLSPIIHVLLRPIISMIMDPITLAVIGLCAIMLSDPSGRF
jgi:hypothetical protein